jgi:nicotinamide-nucleotide amidase
LESKELVALLREQGRTITTAESLTGGRIAAAITAVPGSSQVVPGGVVSYCDQVKHLLLGVPAETLSRFGAVSEPVAKAMAAGAAKLLGTDLAISATGLAGPDGDGINPVGTVYLGLWADGNEICKKQVFSGDRAAVQAQAVAAALEMALEYLR